MGGFIKVMESVSLLIKSLLLCKKMDVIHDVTFSFFDHISLFFTIKNCIRKILVLMVARVKVICICEGGGGGNPLEHS